MAPRPLALAAMCGVAFSVATAADPAPAVTGKQVCDPERREWASGTLDIDVAITLNGR